MHVAFILFDLISVGSRSRDCWGRGLSIFSIVWIQYSISSHGPGDRTYSTGGYSSCSCEIKCLPNDELKEATELVSSGSRIWIPPLPNLRCRESWGVEVVPSRTSFLPLKVVNLGLRGGSSWTVVVKTEMMSWRFDRNTLSIPTKLRCGKVRDVEGCCPRSSLWHDSLSFSCLAWGV